MTQNHLDHALEKLADKVDLLTERAVIMAERQKVIMETLEEHTKKDLGQLNNIDKRLKDLETSVSLAKWSLGALKFIGMSIVAILAFKFGDIKSAFLAWIAAK